MGSFRHAMKSDPLWQVATRLPDRAHGPTKLIFLNCPKWLTVTETPNVFFSKAAAFLDSTLLLVLRGFLHFLRQRK